MSYREIIEEFSSNLSTAELKMMLREDLVYNVTEGILVQMEQKGVSKQHLSKMLGKSRSYVTQLLSGSRNMTLGTLSDICFHLDIEPKLKLNSPKAVTVVHQEPKKSFWIKLDEEIDSHLQKSKHNKMKNVIYREDKADWVKAA